MNAYIRLLIGENFNKKEVTYFKILQKAYKIFVPVANVHGIDIISKKKNSDISALSSCNSLTFDVWTDHRKRSFLGITIRYYVQK